MAEEKSLTPYQLIKLNVEAQIPLVRAMEQEIGKDRAHAIVRKALDDRNRRISQDRVQETPMTIDRLAEEFASFGIGIRFEFKELNRDQEKFDVDVTKCAYAELMESLKARDLGALLICDCDYALADGLGLELKRQKTCMNGDRICDFRFRKIPD